MKTYCADYKTSGQQITNNTICLSIELKNVLNLFKKIF